MRWLKRFYFGFSVLPSSLRPGALSPVEWAVLGNGPAAYINEGEKPRYQGEYSHASYDIANRSFACMCWGSQARGKRKSSSCGLEQSYPPQVQDLSVSHSEDVQRQPAGSGLWIYKHVSGSTIKSFKCAHLEMVL
jgi:hypothetical protein